MTNVITNPKIEFKGQFAVNPDYIQDRTGNYERRDKVAAKWLNAPANSVIEGNGNCNQQFCFDVKKQTFKFMEDRPYMDENFIPMYRIMSPALLLYRLICTFFGTPVCEDSYKMVWWYNLEHKATGKKMFFSEWKGAVGFWVPDYTHTKLNKEFKADLIELMNYIVSNECTHPYDNLVAGSVA